MKIFEHKNYPSVMYLSILIVSLLLLFNFINIIDSNDYKKTLTGNAVINQEDESKSELYSTSAYLIFYAIVMSLISFIFLLSMNLINKIKRK